ncbi:MAG: class I SAM-dependent methyltransferase [Bacteroidales bacterium]|nr:class I SAM-dependent methyltransferase [Bacteroidales bacterium]
MRTLPTDKTWRIYGKKAPYFGVFGQERYRNENLTDDVFDGIFTDASDYVNGLFSVIHTRIDPGFSPGTILDFGCGPGRMLVPFSRFANRVTGLDISADVLEEARKNCEKFNVSNVFLLLSDDGLKSLKNEKFDLVHSFIVLQHLNVKRGEKIIRLLLESIKPGGMGVFHVTYHDSFPDRRTVNFFRFRIPFLANVLRWVRFRMKNIRFDHFPQMQMNNYNLNRIFALLQKEKTAEVFVRFTDHHRYWGVIFYFKKRDA